MDTISVVKWCNFFGIELRVENKVPYKIRERKVDII
jgi:hypothetical protein